MYINAVIQYLFCKLMKSFTSIITFLYLECENFETPILIF